MKVNIAPDFSVYDLLGRVQNFADSALVNHRRTMNIISYEIENATLIGDAQTRIFSSFQRMSRFLPQVERYTQIAQKAESVYVFGIPDVKPPEIPGITYVALKPTDRLADEWFIVSYGRDYASALATQELSSIDDPDDMRSFKGIWTFDLNMVSIMEQWLSSTVDAQIILLNQDSHNRQRQTELMHASQHRLLTRLQQKPRTHMDTIIQDEIRMIMHSGVYAAV